MTIVNTILIIFAIIITILGLVSILALIIISYQKKTRNKTKEKNESNELNRPNEPQNVVDAAKQTASPQDDQYYIQKKQDGDQYYNQQKKSGDEYYNQKIEAANNYFNEMILRGKLAYDEKLAIADRLVDKDREIETAKLDKRIIDLKQSIEKKEAEYQSQQNRIAEVNLQLQEISNRYGLALKIESRNDERSTYEYRFAAGEQELFKEIRKLQREWIQYSADFGIILWKRVLKQIQEWNKIGGLKTLNVRGIYKLTLKSDENVCYIGQATDIYSRWQEHMKKMCGVTPHGDEKLYKYSVEDFTWSVLESGSNINLNESEKYWIEFFKATEVGLNKRK